MLQKMSKFKVQTKINTRPYAYAQSYNIPLRDQHLFPGK